MRESVVLLPVLVLPMPYAAPIPMPVFRKSGLYGQVGAEDFAPNIDAALELAAERGGARVVALPTVRFCQEVLYE